VNTVSQSQARQEHLRIAVETTFRARCVTPVTCGIFPSTKIIPVPFKAKVFDENRARKRQERTLSRDHRHGSKPRTSRACFHHTIKDIHRTHAWERQRSLLVRRSFTPVTAFVGEEGQPTKQRAVLCTSETLVHNLKVGVFNRCLKLFSVFCLSVTTSRGTVDAGKSEHQVRRAHLIPTTGARNAEENEMAVKLMVMYPRPRDIEAFEKIYDEEHVPMAIAKLAGKTKMVGTKILGSPQGTPGSRRCTSPQWRFSKRALLRKAASRPSRTRCRSLPEEPRPS